ncbi:aminopeptidase P family protein [Bradyrhizobium canariense]|uniref:M24 family metallopeptidase n=1 Tax=Bradyrhizobium canariense TaxID=255045 RepID=UPI001C686D48|nr:Xaa-Pro peptidase family protein [Bradyrhizobium canariense]MBW5434059.1 aminopeptidase P family protein [Bradyrhizobium canariense]
MRFENREYQARVERLRAELRARKLDVLLVDDCETTAYYFNYDVSVSFYRAGFIPVEREPFFVLRSLDVAPLAERTWIKDIVGYADWETPATVIAEQFRRRGLDRARIGVDLTSHGLTVQTFEALKRELPQAEFVDVDALPWKMRKLKSKAELENLRSAAAVTDATMQEIVKAVKPGFTEREAARIALDGYLRHGGDPGPLGVITVGRGWNFLHGNLHDTPLQQGDVLHVELLPRVEGYSSRLMRNVVLGDIPPELEVQSRKMIELQDMQIAAMKPGAIAKDVDRIMRQGAIDAGLRKDYTNNTGYTLGYYSSRLMRAGDFTWVFLPNSEWVLEEGMVFHMCTSARGIAISETVVVGLNGAERLSKLERRLFSSNEGVTPAKTAV